MFCAAVSNGMMPNDFWGMAAEDFWLFLRARRPELFKMPNHEKLVELIEKRKQILASELNEKTE